MSKPTKKPLEDQSSRSQGQDKKKPRKEGGKDLAEGNKFAETVKIMANTSPISNEEIIKRSKKRKT